MPGIFETGNLGNPIIDTRSQPCGISDEKQFGRPTSVDSTGQARRYEEIF